MTEPPARPARSPYTALKAAPQMRQPRGSQAGPAGPRPVLRVQGRAGRGHRLLSPSGLAPAPRASDGCVCQLCAPVPAVTHCHPALGHRRVPGGPQTLTQQEETAITLAEGQNVPEREEPGSWRTAAPSAPAPRQQLALGVFSQGLAEARNTANNLTAAEASGRCPSLGCPLGMSPSSAATLGLSASRWEAPAARGLELTGKSFPRAYFPESQRPEVPPPAEVWVRLVQSLPSVPRWPPWSPEYCQGLRAAPRSPDVPYPMSLLGEVRTCPHVSTVVCRVRGTVPGSRCKWHPRVGSGGGNGQAPGEADLGTGVRGEESPLGGEEGTRGTCSWAWGLAVAPGPPF